MNNTVLFEDMVWYGAAFLEDLAAFLIEPPVIWFVAFGIMYYIGSVVKRLVS